MEHTHLVKGLDYALLQKVRSEIQSKEAEIFEMEKPPPSEPPEKKPAPVPEPEPEPTVSSGKEEQLTFK